MPLSRLIILIIAAHHHNHPRQREGVDNEHHWKNLYCASFRFCRHAGMFKRTLERMTTDPGGQNKNKTLHSRCKTAMQIERLSPTEIGSLVDRQIRFVHNS